MAIGPCRECNQQVSTEAKTCPHCGVHCPTFAQRSSAVLRATLSPPKLDLFNKIAISFLLVLAVLGINEALEKFGATSKGCGNELQCAASKGIAAAGVSCKRDIERLASYSVRWTDTGLLETKFDRFRWLDSTKGTITFIGDKAEFQNGFGVYQPVIYECDFDPAINKVLNTRAEPGRLP